MIGTWEIDANGYIATATIQSNSGGYAGSIRFDVIGAPETLTDIRIGAGTVSFRRGTQLYSGQFSGDLAIGTYTQDGSSIEYSWEAHRASSGAGLVALGDFNHDGVIDNRDVAEFIESFGIRLSSYRVCDDAYNPGCFGLLDNQPRPGGLPKAVDPSRHDDLGIAVRAYPPHLLPTIREIGAALLNCPRSLVDPVLRSQGWTMDFVGFAPASGLSSSHWHINANGFPGYLMLWRNGPAARVRFGSGPWEPLTDIRVIYDPAYGRSSPPVALEFRRTLAADALRRFAGGVERYAGQFRGSSGGGVFATELRGSFTFGSGVYDWHANGDIRVSGESDLEIVSNGITGRLKLRLDDSYSGRLVFRDDSVDDGFAPMSMWEPIANIQDRRVAVTFQRHRFNQEYTGTVNGNSIRGSYTYAGASYDWSGTRILQPGGTSQPGCVSRPDWELGTVCRTIWLGIIVARRTASQEAISHPLESALARGQAPFTAADRAAYRDSSLWRSDSTPRPTRPGFVSDYAANDGDYSHDLVETIDYYMAEPATLYSLAVQDLLRLRSDLLWKKREFVREHYSTMLPSMARGGSMQTAGPAGWNSGSRRPALFRCCHLQR